MRRRFIPLSTPNLIGNESKYLKECVKTEWVSSSGKFVETFENKIKRIVGSKYAIACVNGTSALQLSLKLAGATSGDEVIVPSLTFIAPVNAVHYNNCSPIFMDSDEFFNIDVNKTIDFIKKFTKFDKGISVNKISKKKIVAIILVHVFGNAILMDKLIKLCKSRNIQIIEDASESLGTKFKRGIYKNKHTGSVGLLGCFSFNGNKIITSGGGGMIVTNNQKIAKRAKYLTTQAKDNADFFIHNDIGYNFRLTNLNAAVGLAKLEKLEKFIKIKKRINKIHKKKTNKIDGLRIAE